MRGRRPSPRSRRGGVRPRARCGPRGRRGPSAGSPGAARGGVQGGGGAILVPPPSACFVWIWDHHGLRNPAGRYRHQYTVIFHTCIWLSLAAIGCRSLAIYTRILRPLLPFSVNGSAAPGYHEYNTYTGKMLENDATVPARSGIASSVSASTDAVLSSMINIWDLRSVGPEWGSTQSLEALPCGIFE